MSHPDHSSLDLQSTLFCVCLQVFLELCCLPYAAASSGKLVGACSFKLLSPARVDFCGIKCFPPLIHNLQVVTYEFSCKKLTKYKLVK